MPTISTQQVVSFYTASLAALRFLERASSGRCIFGPDADARWKGFKGDLELQDRIDLAVRDAAVRWGAAFSPARVFQLTGLAADEPFGPDWPGIDADSARRLWREAEQAEVSTYGATVARVAAAWAISLVSVDPGELKPATKVLVCGPSAVAALVSAFHGREDLSWADQVVAVGSAPAERHLSGLAAPVLGSRGPTRLVSPERAKAQDTAPGVTVRDAGLSAVDRLVVSEDASPLASEMAHTAAKALS